MTLEQIDAALRKGEDHNTRVATEKKLYAERLKKEFGAESSEELRKMRADATSQLAAKEQAYQAALAAAEELLRKAGVVC